jgi:hypothetical protein
MARDVLIIPAGIVRLSMERLTTSRGCYNLFRFRSQEAWLHQGNVKDTLHRRVRNSAVPAHPPIPFADQASAVSHCTVLSQQSLSTSCISHILISSNITYLPWTHSTLNEKKRGKVVVNMSSKCVFWRWFCVCHCTGCSLSQIKILSSKGNHTTDAIMQGSATCPRVACGPRKLFMWPVTWFGY